MERRTRSNEGENIDGRASPPRRCPSHRDRIPLPRSRTTTAARDRAHGRLARPDRPDDELGRSRASRPCCRCHLSTPTANHGVLLLRHAVRHAPAPHRSAPTTASSDVYRHASYGWSKRNYFAQMFAAGQRTSEATNWAQGRLATIFASRKFLVSIGTAMSRRLRRELPSGCFSCMLLAWILEDIVADKLQDTRRVNRDAGVVRLQEIVGNASLRFAAAAGWFLSPVAAVLRLGPLRCVPHHRKGRRTGIWRRSRLSRLTKS